MSVTVNKQLSPAKELFLSIALVAQEISSDTIKMMKEDYSDSVIRNSVIKSLRKKGYIQRIGECGSYGYVLTGDGYDYVRIKFPDKFQYQIFQMPSHIYDRELRGKRRQMSSVLYNLFREGVDFSDHAAELAAIFNGEAGSVSKPFFITTKEMTYVHSRLNTTYGTRLYGAIVTQSKFILLYAPSIEKNLHARIETGLYQSVKNALSYAAAPYNLPVNNEYLYMYQSDADIVDSFSEIGKRSAQTASTYRMYVKSLLKEAHIFRMNGSTYRLSDVFDENRKRAINAAFMEYYEVKPRPRSNMGECNISGYYRNTDIPVFMVWDLSPSALVSAMEYTRQKGFGINGQVYLLCFEEDAKLIADILNLDRKMAKHFSVCDLPYQEVIRYINGEITHIE